MKIGNELSSPPNIVVDMDICEILCNLGAILMFSKAYTYDRYRSLVVSRKLPEGP